MSKFIQTHFFYHSIFSLSTKQKGEKIKYFLSFQFFIILPFSIFLLFYSFNKMDPKENLPIEINWNSKFISFFYFLVYFNLLHTRSTVNSP